MVQAAIPLDRVVALVASFENGSEQIGSGYLVGGRLVLTAEHCTRDLLSKAPLHMLRVIRSSDGLAAKAVETIAAPTLDVAVVRLENSAPWPSELPPVTFARVDRTRSGKLQDCQAIGYPLFQRDPDQRTRHTAELHGTIYQTDEFESGHLLMREPLLRPGATSGPARNTSTADDLAGQHQGPSPWGGLSGALIFYDGRAVGVIVEHHPRQGDAALRALAFDTMVIHANRHPGADAIVEVLELTEASLAWVTAEAVRPVDELPRVVGMRVSAAVESWFDRDELRVRLRRLLFERRRIISITGRRGVGKSAVVAKVLAEFETANDGLSPSENLDGLVYLSTRTESLTPTLLVERVAVLAGRDQQTRLTELWAKKRTEALGELWASLRHRRLVLVLDNLDDLQDAETGKLKDGDFDAFFVSVCRTPYPPKVVTTSVKPLVLPTDTLTHVELLELSEGLPTADAVSLLRQMGHGQLGFRAATDEQLGAAVNLLHRLPRGLELLAPRIAKSPSYLGRLLDSKKVGEELQDELVSESFRTLNAVGRQVVGLLALAAVPLPQSAVTTMLAGLAHATQCANTIEELIESRELGFDSNGMVRLHPLDADYVLQVLAHKEPATQAALDLRLADWYRAARTPPGSWRVVSDTLPNRREFDHRWRAGEHAEALAALEEAASFLARKGEAPLVREAVARAEQVVQHPQARLAVERCRFYAEFFDGSLDAAEAALGAARAIALEADLREVVASLETEWGTVRRHRGDPAGAIEILQPIADGNVDGIRSAIRLDALFELALSRCYLKDWTGAETAAAELAAAVPHGLADARVADVRALARLGMGDYEGALVMSDQGIRLYEDSAHQDNACYLHNVKGMAYLHLNDLNRAEKALSRGLAVAASMGIDRLEGLCAINLVWTLLRANRWAEAAEKAALGEDRLSFTGVRAAATAKAVVGLLGAPPRTVEETRIELEGAVEGASGNTDVYMPSAEVLDAIAAALATRSVVVPDLTPGNKGSPAFKG